MHPFTTRLRNHGKASQLAVLFAFGIALSPSFAPAQGELAATELAKRQAKVEEARELVARGDQAMQEERPDLAVEAYEGARELLPVAPALEKLRDAVTERYIAAALSQSAILANKGDLVAAKEMVGRILSKGVAPKHPGALKMREQLNDPIRVNPALTPEHHVNVQEVMRFIQLANGAIALGRYDLAEQSYQDILRIDPHNVLARRGLERVLELKGKSKVAAFDETRAEMLLEVDKAWELQVPPNQEDIDRLTGNGVDETPADVTVRAKLRQIIIPNLALDQVNLRDAIDYLRVVSASEDLITEDQENRGINFTLNLGTEDSPITQRIENKRFDLNLRNVPVEQALKYITEMTGTAYMADDFAVTIVPQGQLTAEIFMRSYSVPPNFIAALSEGAAGGANDDPFAQANPNQGLLTARLPVQELLKRKGVSFGEGASASYSGATNQLRVVNTADNHSMVEQLVEVIKGEDPIIISVQVTMIKAQQSKLTELGFDWLLTPFDMGQNAFLGGGTDGNTLGRTVSDFSSTLPLAGGADATANNVITNGLRSGDRAFLGDNIDAIINNPSRSSQNSRVAPGVLALTGLLNEGQVQLMMRGIDQKTGIDTMARPSIVTRSGETASIVLAREFIYPTEYDPPELQQGGGGGGQFGGGGNAAGPAFPVVPANPTAFETRNVGITLEVVPVSDQDKRYISLTLNPEIVEFDGFVNYGSPITVPVTDTLGNVARATLTDNEILMPIFSTKRALTQLTVADGATVAFGGLMTQSIKTVEDKVPVLGDLPLLGRLFSSQSQLPVSTAIVFLVKVDLMDPTGRNYRDIGRN